MKIRTKLLLAITVPVGLLVVQIALVNVFVRELQEAATFISATHNTIEETFVAGDLLPGLRNEAKRLPTSFVSDRALGDEGLGHFHELFGELNQHIQSISQSVTTHKGTQKSLLGLETAFVEVQTRLALAENVLAYETVDMDTLLAHAIYLDATLVNVSSALTELSQGLRVQLQDAVDREREIHDRPVIAGLAIGGLSVLMLLFFTWLVVDRYFISRLTDLSSALLSIAGGDLRASLPEPKGSDEVDEMARTVETFRFTALERDRLLSEAGEAAERLEQQVAQRTAELESANQYKTKFLAIASHDLRQPLHALNLFIEQIRDKPGPEQRDQLEGQISEAAKSLNELFDALLDMSKLEAGVMKAEITSFPIASVFGRLEATFATAAENKNLRFRIVSSDLWVRSDAILLERILLNLVSNALRATTDGGIVVGCRRRGNSLRVDVCDTGPGIPEELHGKLFKDFFSVELSSSAYSDSLGLGLSIVDGLAQLLGHKIELSSNHARGTRFSVTLPISAAETEQKIHPESPVQYEPMHGRKILVVDDDELVRESMAGIFDTWGCEVELAEGVADAVGVVASGFRPDLIISDYLLANGQTGIEAISNVHQICGRNVPAFLITAETGFERKRDIAKNGFPILYKPVTPMALRSLSWQLLDSAAQTGKKNSRFDRT